MSAIDWEAKPEPWRTAGLRFSEELQRLHSGKPPRLLPKKERAFKLRQMWSKAALNELISLREEKHMSWGAIGAKFGRTAQSVRVRYRKQRILEADANE